MVHCHEVVLSTVHSVFIADFEHGHFFLFCFQVQYPSNPMQPEPIYFLFGVCNEAEGSQLFYLIDDSTVASKGAHVAVLYLPITRMMVSFLIACRVGLISLRIEL